MESCAPILVLHVESCLVVPGKQIQLGCFSVWGTCPVKWCELVLITSVNVHFERVEIKECHSLVTLSSNVQAVESICILAVFVCAAFNQQFEDVNVSFPGCIVEGRILLFLGFYIYPLSYFWWLQLSFSLCNESFHYFGSILECSHMEQRVAFIVHNSVDFLMPRQSVEIFNKFVWFTMYDPVWAHFSYFFHWIISYTWKVTSLKHCFLIYTSRSLASPAIVIIIFLFFIIWIYSGNILWLILVQRKMSSLCIRLFGGTHNSAVSSSGVWGWNWTINIVPPLQIRTWTFRSFLAWNTCCFWLLKWDLEVISRDVVLRLQQFVFCSIHFFKF